MSISFSELSEDREEALATMLFNPESFLMSSVVPPVPATVGSNNP